jgi:hypothetical protein
MDALELSPTEAALAFLAVTYHLARPGSELDPESKQPVAHGLREVSEALAPQLGSAPATIELTPYQYRRLLTALAGALNELKMYALLDRGRQTTVPAFHVELARLFPKVADDPDEASKLAAQIMALRRRVESSLPGDEPVQPKRSRWRFWERSDEDA